MVAYGFIIPVWPVQDSLNLDPTCAPSQQVRGGEPKCPILAGARKGHSMDQMIKRPVNGRNIPASQLGGVIIL